jgi:predicted RNA binding protein YcfA (HicA-like mRNA interferase family)
MKLPRDLSGRDLAAALGALDYAVIRRSGGHMRLATTRRGDHHITIPDHSSLRAGTLNAILRDVAEHHRLPREQLLELLFGR